MNCAGCEGDARTTCVAKIRDECEDFPEGEAEHEACEGDANAACDAAEGEGEGE